MSIAECRNDPCWLLCRVYDDHQPAGRSGFTLEEPLSIGPSLLLPMVGRLKCVEHRLQMRLKLGVAVMRVQDMQQPRVLEDHHSQPVGCARLSQNRPFAHARLATSMSPRCKPDSLQCGSPNMAGEATYAFGPPNARSTISTSARSAHSPRSAASSRGADTYSRLLVIRSISAIEVSPSRTFVSPSSRKRRIPSEVAMATISSTEERSRISARIGSLTDMTSYSPRRPR